MKSLFLFSTLGLLLVTAVINAQVADCPGVGICTNMSGTMASGSINELNAINSGCLPDYEAPSSYWFQICLSSDGTIAFTVNPSGANNDYDFAVWGPGGSCPPTVPPIRCSYAHTPPGGGSNGDVTGLSFGSADNAEGPGGNGWLAPINGLAGECYLVYLANYAGGIATFDLIFTGTAGYDCAVLPVELSSFSGSATPDGVLLNWDCASETNNSHFIIERTTDGITYEVIGRVAGAGTSSQMTLYSYLDLTAQDGINYYRLIQVDYNGIETKHGPISCEYISSGASIVEIVNLNGQIVYSGETSNYLSTIHEQNLAEGIYTVVITRGNSRRAFKHAVAGLSTETD